jgi:hypothetical protein
MSTTTETGRRRTSEFAVASLTMGILTFVNLLAVERAVPAIVFGVLALRRMKADGQLKGKGLASWWTPASTPRLGKRRPARIRMRTRKTR